MALGFELIGGLWPPIHFCQHFSSPKKRISNFVLTYLKEKTIKVAPIGNIKMVGQGIVNFAALFIVTSPHTLTRRWITFLTPKVKIKAPRKKVMIDIFT